MSNRTLIEINHDGVHMIGENHDQFVQALCDYLNSADYANTKVLRKFGVTIFGTRHHSDPFKINWGGTKAKQGK